MKIPNPNTPSSIPFAQKETEGTKKSGVLFVSFVTFCARLGGWETRLSSRPPPAITPGRMTKPRKPTPKPWSMKWIIVAIVIFVVGYTAVNFFYRKKGPAYRPYQDAQDRATTSRLLAAGWHKIPIETRRPMEKPDFDGAAA